MKPSEILFGMPESITHCMPKPIGCGRDIPFQEIMSWPVIDRQEFRISHLCKTCQDEIFTEEDPADFEAYVQSLGAQSLDEENESDV